jgi:osmoprotectant transport system ATP-binding protein
MLELEAVRKSYDGGDTFAVDGVGFRADSGERVVLVGESGCGKSTTLKLINRLVEPTSGVIRVDGRDVLERDAVELRRSIGWVIQHVGLFPHMSVAENVAVVPALLGWPAGRIRRRIDELLELVHLEPAVYRERMPRELSGGQMQRVGFARALAAEPSAVLLDEPFGALDPVTRDHLQQEFVQIQRQIGFAAVFVTHDMAEALVLADRIVVLRAGRCAQIGTPREILTRPADAGVSALMASALRQSERLAAVAGSAAEPRAT